MDMTLDQNWGAVAEQAGCYDCRYEAWKAEEADKLAATKLEKQWKAEEADKLAATKLEKQWQASKDATVQRRRQMVARLREAINEMQLMAREPMAEAQYKRVCVAIVSLITAHDELEVMS